MIRITNNDSFVWLVVTHKAKEIFDSRLFELYILYDVGTESLVLNRKDLDDALSLNFDIGIEVGYLY